MNPETQSPTPQAGPTIQPQTPITVAPPISEAAPIANPINNVQPAASYPSPQQFVSAPAAGQSASPASAPTSTIILQWLTYALWGWTVLVTSCLATSVIAGFFDNNDTSSFTTYSIAAVLVLLPFAYIADLFYRRVEEQKKTGASAIVMVVHAVIFGLFGIGSLIAAVIALVIMFTSSGDTSGPLTALLSALVVFVLYLATFVRTLRPQVISNFIHFYPILMVVIIGILAILGFIGPVAQARLTKNDRLIEYNIESLNSAVQNYTRTNNRLPDTLNEVSIKGDTKALVDNKLVTYKPNSKPSSLNSSGINLSDFDSDFNSTERFTNELSSSNNFQNQSKTYYYQLCVTYKKDNTSSNNYSYDDYNSRDGYTRYISAYAHPAGEVCYKIYAEGN